MTSPTLLWIAVLGALHLFGLQVAEGLITETTEFNKPKFSFACGTQLGGGGTPTFCSNQGDKKYVKVGRVDIYRDNSNKVGDCLKPEKDYITVVLIEWFNYDCKIPNVQRDVENKEMPTGMLQTAMTKYCSIPNARVYKIEVEYDCVSTLATGPPPVLVEDRGGILIVPPRLPVVPDNLSESTASTTTPSRPSTTTTGKLPILITADKESNTAPAPAPTPSSDNSGGVIETTASNRPPFSFGCSPQLGGVASTFCGAAENNTQMSIDLVEIYRDYTNQVGHCLDPEKAYIAQILHEWFNYDCKIPVATRGEEFKVMPVHMLKVAMTAHCGIALAGLSRIVVHYQCVKASPLFKGSTEGVRTNGAVKSAD